MAAQPTLYSGCHIVSLTTNGVFGGAVISQTAILPVMDYRDHNQQAAVLKVIWGDRFQGGGGAFGMTGPVQ